LKLQVVAEKTAKGAKGYFILLHLYKNILTLLF